MVRKLNQRTLTSIARHSFEVLYVFIIFFLFMIFDEMNIFEPRRSPEFNISPIMQILFSIVDHF